MPALRTDNEAATVAFLFAPRFHPGLRGVAPIRRRLPRRSTRLVRSLALFPPGGYVRRSNSCSSSWGADWRHTMLTTAVALSVSVA